MKREDYKYYENEKEYELEVGDKVVITSDCGANGKIGIIISSYKRESREWNTNQKHTYMMVEFDKKHRQSFNQRSLKPIKKGEKMEIKSDYVVGINFKSGYDDTYKGQQHMFLCYLKDFKIGDFVVVNTKKGYTICKIVSIYTKEQCLEKNIYTTKEIICKINDEEYLIRRNKEKLEAQKEERREEIQLKINKRVEELKTEYVLEVLSQVDTELKSLLNEYNEV